MRSCSSTASTGLPDKTCEDTGGQRQFAPLISRNQAAACTRSRSLRRHSNSADAKLVMTFPWATAYGA